ncbi:MAG: hypothetical protein HFF03_07300 [Oscillospiraceae bacterium]|jgi:hypothetical protein|nr:hypothetical protein [Oscillospiraceae bacterium]
MKSEVKSTDLLLTGVMIGTSLSGPAANAAAEFFQAQRTPHPIYVDGQQVQMETYAINGSNYVKLRDIGQAVGFEVYWDGSAARIVSDKPYTGEPPIQGTLSAVPNHSAQANSAVFTGYLSAGVYNTIREAILTKQTTPFGSDVSGFIGLRHGNDGALFQKAEEETQQINNVLASLGSYPSYELIPSDTANQYLCQVQYAELYTPAAEHTKDFIASLDGLSEREKIKQIAWYVCDRIAYDKTCYAWPNEVLTQDGVAHGACMSYAYSFRFLCHQAGIPCVLKHGGNHQWNTVYAEGRWWDVDVTADDCDKVVFTTSGSTESSERLFDGTDEFREQFYVTADQVLKTEESFPDEDPEIIKFAQEVLVPGSTK